MIKYFKIESITETYNLIRAAIVCVIQLAVLKKAEHREKNRPRRKSKTEGDIRRLRQEVSFMEMESKGELGLKKNAY